MASKPDLQRTITVPVIADSVPRDTTDALARCSYLTIFADEPNLGMLTLNSVPAPFVMLGLSGILFRPIRLNESEFDSSDYLDELVNLIESIEGLAVETEYLWLPTERLDRARSAVGSPGSVDPVVTERGDVFRIGHELFTTALAATREATGFAQFTAAARDQEAGEASNPAVRYSPRETEAVQMWSRKHVNDSQQFRR